MIKVAVIGNGTQSKRIQKILKKLKYAFLIYKPSNKKQNNILNFEKIKKCNVIFICSPNNSHIDYIKKLNLNRFIFCEKPPVSKIKDLNYLKKLNAKKIYFNYNFRFLKISEILSNLKRYKLGKLIYANIITTKGLAAKKEYKNNWRADKKKCPKGVFEMVSIHILDLINFFFKVRKIHNLNLFNFSNVGNGFDTSEVKLELENKAIVNIFSSYYAPLYKGWLMIFDNGMIKLENNKIEIRGPRNNFDKNGLFAPPKIIKAFNISATKDYNNSLFKSVFYFLNKCKKNSNFSRQHYKTSLDSNLLILR